MFNYASINPRTLQHDFLGIEQQGKYRVNTFWLVSNNDSNAAVVCDSGATHSQQLVELPHTQAGSRKLGKVNI